MMRKSEDPEIKPTHSRDIAFSGYNYILNEVVFTFLRA